MTINISLEKLFESGAYLGHQTRRWNPKMKDYLYGEEDGVHLFDLAKTSTLLGKALEVLQNAKKEGKKVLIVGTKKQAKEKVKEVAQKVGAFFVCERWLGGTLTNFDQLQKSLKKLGTMKMEREAGAYKKFTKKERLLLDREITRLEKFFGGLTGMNKMPDYLFVIDTKKEIGAIREASKKGVEVIAIVDSNSDPDLVDWEIPMNDDASKAIDYVMSLVEEAMMDKQSRSKNKVEKEKTKKLEIKK